MPSAIIDHRVPKVYRNSACLGFIICNCYRAKILPLTEQRCLRFSLRHFIGSTVEPLDSTLQVRLAVQLRE